MILEIDEATLKSIQSHGEAAYPEEGAGLLLGMQVGEVRQVRAIDRLKNTREDIARRNRYLLSPQDFARGEQEAARLGWDVVGVFHSHPDHPSQPSDFDREWAMPWFSYLITSIEKGAATSTRSWRLAEDRSKFEEEAMKVVAKRYSNEQGADTIILLEE
jgi:proteasome lid subunit RPN8/RPN11